MKMKSVRDCLNFIDIASVEKDRRCIGILNLENVHKYLFEKRRTDFIEDRIALSNVLGQINSIIENYYQFPEKDIKNEYIQLKKLILVWLIVWYRA